MAHSIFFQAAAPSICLSIYSYHKPLIWVMLITKWWEVQTWERPYVGLNLFLSSGERAVQHASPGIYPEISRRCLLSRNDRVKHGSFLWDLFFFVYCYYTQRFRKSSATWPLILFGNLPRTSAGTFVLVFDVLEGFLKFVLRSVVRSPVHLVDYAHWLIVGIVINDLFLDMGFQDIFLPFWASLCFLPIT